MIGLIKRLINIKIKKLNNKKKRLIKRLIIIMIKKLNNKKKIKYYENCYFNNTI